MDRPAAVVRSVPFVVVGRDRGRAMSKPRGERFIVTLRPVPSGPDAFGRGPAYRLKRFLKIAWRRFGLQAVSVEFAPSATPDAEPAGRQVTGAAAVTASDNRLREPVEPPGGNE